MYFYFRYWLWQPTSTLLWPEICMSSITRPAVLKYNSQPLHFALTAAEIRRANSPPRQKVLFPPPSSHQCLRGDPLATSANVYRTHDLTSNLTEQSFCLHPRPAQIYVYMIVYHQVFFFLSLSAVSFSSMFSWVFLCVTSISSFG